MSNTGQLLGRAVTGRVSLFQRKLRGRLSPRSALMWLLLVLLVAGAASYSQGSRYALAAQSGPFLSVGSEPVNPAVSPTETRETDSEPLMQAAADAPQSPDADPARDTRSATPCLDTRPKHQHCYAWYLAPRGEPSPLRAAALEPPPLMSLSCPDVIKGSAPSPDEPIQALTVIQLSISRT